MNKIFELRGHCFVKSSLSLDELAKLISSKLFGNIPFICGEHNIWEEIPSMYIDNSLLGMLIILGGYGVDERYELAKEQHRSFTNNKLVFLSDFNVEKLNLSKHLYYLLKGSLFEYPEIEVIEFINNENS